MPLSWNEIRHNAIRFASDWTGEKRECAEKQTFWNEFFEVFGVKRRVVASFEEPVRKISGKYGYIDLFWRRTLLVEHKSLGQDLGNAGSQAFLYIQDLVNEGRVHKHRADFQAGEIGVLCSFGAGYSIGSVILRKA